MSTFKYLIWILFVGLVSLSCQPNTSYHKADNNTIEGKEVPSDWIDPLFFIDGQLCQHLRKIFQDVHGNLWFGTNVYGIMRYDGDTLEYFDERHGFAGGRIIGIVEDKEGNVWFGSARGLSKYSPAEDSSEVRFHNYVFSGVSGDNEIWSLMIDKESQFWIGTLKGVYQFDGQSFKSFELPKAAVVDTSTIMSFDRITAILQDREGGIWFGRDGFGITRLYEGRIQQFTKGNGLPDNSIQSLLEDQKGNVWIGSMYGGLARWYDGQFVSYPFGKPIKGWEVGALFQDRQSQVWFASENHGIYRYDPTSDAFDHFGKAQGLLTEGILSIYEDRSGRYWMGGWGGLFRYFPESEDSTNLFLPVTKTGPWN